MKKDPEWSNLDRIPEGLIWSKNFYKKEKHPASWKKSKLENTSNDCHVFFDTADVLQEQKGNIYKLKLWKLCDVGNISNELLKHGSE